MIVVGYPPPEPFLTRFGGATELGTFLWIQLRGFFAQDEGGADDDLHVTHQPSLPCSMVYDCARVFDARLTTVCAQCSPIHFCRCNCNTPRSLSLSSCFIDCYFKEQVSKTRSKKVCTTYTLHSLTRTCMQKVSFLIVVVPGARTTHKNKKSGPNRERTFRL